MLPAFRIGNFLSGFCWEPHRTPSYLFSSVLWHNISGLDCFFKSEQQNFYGSCAPDRDGKSPPVFTQVEELIQLIYSGKPAHISGVNIMMSVWTSTPIDHTASREIHTAHSEQTQIHIESRLITDFDHLVFQSREKIVPRLVRTQHDRQCSYYILNNWLVLSCVIAM